MAYKKEDDLKSKDSLVILRISGGEAGELEAISDGEERSLNNKLLFVSHG